VTDLSDPGGQLIREDGTDPVARARAKHSTASADPVSEFDSTNLPAALTAGLVPVGDSRRVVTTFTDAGIQAAINDLAANGGGAVELLPGTYTVTATITVPDNVRLTGAGPGRTVLNQTVAGLAAIIQNADQTNGNSGIEIDNFTMLGSKALEGVSSRYGLHTIRCTGSRIHDLEAANVAGNGFYLEGVLSGGSGSDTVRVLLADNLYGHDNAQDGIWIKSGYREVVGSNLRGRNNGRHGIHLDHSESTYTNLHAWGNGQYGIFLDNLHSGNFHGLVAARNGLDGIHAVSLRNSVGSSWVAQCNGMAAPATSADIFFDPVPRGYGQHQNVVVSGVVCGYSAHYDYDNLGLAAFAASPISLPSSNIAQDVYLASVVQMPSTRPSQLPTSLGYVLSAQALRDVVTGTRTPSSYRTVVNDSGLRSGGNALAADSGQTYTASSGATWAAAAAGLQCTNTGGGRRTLTAAVGNNGQTSADITYQGGGGAAVIARSVDTSNLLAAEITSASFRVRLIIGGAATVLATTPLTPVAGDRFRVTFTYDQQALRADLYDSSGARLATLSTTYDSTSHATIGGSRNTGLMVTAQDNAYFTSIAVLRGSTQVASVPAAAVDAATTQALVNSLRTALIQQGLVA